MKKKLTKYQKLKLEYSCTIQLVKYGKDDFYYEGYINSFANVVGGGKTIQKCYEELYGNLDAYLGFLDDLKKEGEK